MVSTLLVAQQFLVDQVFNVLQLLVLDRREMRKIKPQMIRRHQRPRLLHMLPQHFTQPSMQQMRSRMIPHSSMTNFGVDDSVDTITNPEGAPFLARILREKWGF